MERLARTFNSLVRREARFHALYGISDKSPTEKNIDVYICRLRKLCAPLGLKLTTSWGVGYRMHAA